MWIGELNIDLKNLSKNRRKHYRNLKELFDKYYQDKMTAQDFLDTFDIDGKVTHEQLEKEEGWIEQPPFDFGDTDDDVYPGELDVAKETIDNIIADLQAQNFGYKYNEMAHEIVEHLLDMIFQYGYIAVYKGWQDLPPEIQTGMFEENPLRWYEAYEYINSYLEAFVSSEYNSEEAWTE